MSKSDRPHSVLMYDPLPEEKTRSVYRPTLKEKREG